MNFKEIDCFAETFLLIVFATYATIFSFSISTKLSSFYVPTFLKCPTLPKQHSSQDLVHYLTKNRCSLSSERKEENTGLSIIVLLVSFAQISFPACAWPGLRYLMFVRSYFIVCLCVYLTSEYLLFAYQAVWVLKSKVFWIKINCSQMKLPNFVSPSSDSSSKSANFGLSK